MRKRKMSLAALALLIVVVLLGSIYALYTAYTRKGPLSFHEQKKLMASASQEHGWAISKIQGSRSSFYDPCDATDEYIYFAYTDDSCVDVYSISGEFQHSIYFPDSQNGGILLLCDNEKAYITDKNGNMYVFVGEDCVEKIDDPTFGIQERDPAETGLRISRKEIRRYAEDGTLLFQIPTPPMVRATTHLITAPVPKFVDYAVLGLLLLIWLLILIWILVYIKKYRKKPPTLGDDSIAPLGA